jgi:hypothetical protein
MILAGYGEYLDIPVITFVDRLVTHNHSYQKFQHCPGLEVLNMTRKFLFGWREMHSKPDGMRIRKVGEPSRVAFSVEGFCQISSLEQVLSCMIIDFLDKYSVH